MLVYRKKGRKPIVGLDLTTFSMIDDLVPISNLSSVILNWNDELSSVILFDYNDFFEMVKPDDIMVIIYQHLCLIK